MRLLLTLLLIPSVVPSFIHTHTRTEYTHATLHMHCLGNDFKVATLNPSNQLDASDSTQLRPQHTPLVLYTCFHCSPSDLYFSYFQTIPQPLSTYRINQSSLFLSLLSRLFYPITSLLSWPSFLHPHQKSKKRGPFIIGAAWKLRTRPTISKYLLTFGRRENQAS